EAGKTLSVAFFGRDVVGGAVRAGLLAGWGSGSSAGIAAALVLNAVSFFIIELLEIRTTRRSRFGVALPRRFHVAKIHRRCHVIAGKSGQTGTNLEIRARIQKRFYSLGMFLFGRPHQCGSLPQILEGVDVCAGGHQSPDDVGSAVAGGEHKHGLAAWSTLLGIRSSFEQLIDYREIPIERRHCERAYPFAVFHIDLGAGSYQ